MELENKLLKDHVTNNQIFIDKILQHNSKLGENFDVSRTIPVTNEARKQENYHMKGNITKKKNAELNNWQKQEENNKNI